jgi:hypothetical protein
MARLRTMNNFKRWLNQRETEAREKLAAMFPNGKYIQNKSGFSQDCQRACEAINEIQSALRVLDRFEKDFPPVSASLRNKS